MKEWFARHFPRLAGLRWWVSAAAAACAPPRSYAQNGEDAFLLTHVGGIPLARGFYIDAGANHPTKISNTYALYRAGWSGVVIEPNRAFRPLHRFFRPRDTFLNIGIGRNAGILPFYHHVWAVLSGFGEQSAAGARGVEHLPVLPLDALQSLCPPADVLVLSIDVEGLNLEVLESGKALLGQVDYVVIEYGEEEAEIAAFLDARSFTTIHRTVHNLIAQRNRQRCGSLPNPAAARRELA